MVSIASIGHTRDESPRISHGLILKHSELTHKKMCLGFSCMHNFLSGHIWPFHRWS